MKQKKTTLAMIAVLILAVPMVFAGTDNPFTLYGLVSDGDGTANGATVTIYPQSAPSDILTDVVGTAGNFGASGYWKLNLWNFDTQVSDGAVIVIRVEDSNDNYAETTFRINTHFGNQEVGALTLEKEKVDTPVTPSGGSRRGGGGSSSVVQFDGTEDCVPDWVCNTWSECAKDGVATCSLWADLNSCQVAYDGSNTKACDYIETKDSSGSTSEQQDKSGSGEPTGSISTEQDGDEGNLVTGGAITDVGAGNKLFAVFALAAVAGAILVAVFRKYRKK
ncbi:MAG: hypothetical protein KKF44_03730 [Nanoarchaeota archaeon]|nr:hypothetical protein [Nanoarchaeota archaeon]